MAAEWYHRRLGDPIVWPRNDGDWTKFQFFMERMNSPGDQDDATRRKWCSEVGIFKKPYEDAVRDFGQVLTVAAVNAALKPHPPTRRHLQEDIRRLVKNYEIWTRTIQTRKDLHGAWCGMAASDLSIISY